MKAFYQQEMENLDISFSEEKNYQGYPLHFHNNVEIFMVTKGSCTVIVNGDVYNAKEGDIFFFDCYDLHSFINIEGLDAVFIIIPFVYLSEFLKNKDGKAIASPRLSNNDVFAAFLKIGEQLAREQIGKYHKQALIDVLLSLFLEKTDLVKKDSENIVLVRQILIYTHCHFRENINLKSISKALGYSQSYISHIFHQYIRVSLNKYINELRFNEVEYMKEHARKKRMTDIVFEAGFQSQQTYYRYKKERFERAGCGKSSA